MPLPTSWVDHLFARLSVRYGAAFMRQYANADPALVKADWAQLLGGFDGKALQYALDYLPASPPNAVQFRDLCRMSPREEVPALPGPAVDRAHAARVVAEIRAALNADDGNVSPAQKCINNIERIAKTRSLTPSQVWVLECCRRQVSGEPVHGGITQTASTIPADVLPPGMRQGEEVAA